MSDDNQEDEELVQRRCAVIGARAGFRLIEDITDAGGSNADVWSNLVALVGAVFGSLVNAEKAEGAAVSLVAIVRETCADVVNQLRADRDQGPPH